MWSRAASVSGAVAHQHSQLVVERCPVFPVEHSMTRRGSVGRSECCSIDWARPEKMRENFQRQHRSDAGKDQERHWKRKSRAAFSFGSRFVRLSLLVLRFHLPQSRISAEISSHVCVQRSAPSSLLLACIFDRRGGSSSVRSDMSIETSKRRISSFCFSARRHR